MANRKLSDHLTPETWQLVDAFCAKHALPARGRINAMLQLLLDAPAAPPDLVPAAQSPLTLPALLTQLGCAEDDTATVLGVIERQGFVWETFVRTAILSAAERWAKREASVANVAQSDVDARRKVKGTAYAEVAATVERLMEENAHAPALVHRRYLSKPLVERESNCSTIIVRKYFTDHAARIDAHNQAMGFPDFATGRHHNQWVYREYHRDNGVKGHEESVVEMAQTPAVA